MKEVPLSIIIPTFNAENSSFLHAQLRLLTDRDDVEVICVDGGSEDETLSLLNSFPVTVVRFSTNSRGELFNRGIEVSSGSMVLLHHPRSLLDNNGIDYLLKNHNKISWGGFTHIFDVHHPFLELVSWYSNKIRADFEKVFYLDHCIFAQKELLQKVGNVPDIDIFEDTRLSHLLRKQGRPVRLPYYSTTSAMRFTRNGIVWQFLKNQLVKLGYHLGISDKALNRFYEKGLNLNSYYEDE